MSGSRSSLPSEGVRLASHAGSWYEGDPDVLKSQLDGWLSNVDLEREVPVKGARVIIAPHAGYSYSGPCAAWAYSALDVSPSTKRVFVLGPSHTYYLSRMALSTYERYETPFGDLLPDIPTLQELYATGKFDKMSRKGEIDEHSLEMHLPYLYTMLKRALGESPLPPIIPILVGGLDPSEEKKAGEILAPYMSNPENVFIISSDFCHWGSRFKYTAYVPGDEIPPQGPTSVRRSRDINGKPIHDAIKVLDTAAMKAIETGSHDKFIENLALTENTVCGRHPIGVAMAAMDAMGTGKKFKCVRYERSSLVEDVYDSSVSYVSAYAAL